MKKLKASMLWRLSRLELRSGRKMSCSGSLELMSEKSESRDMSDTDQPPESVSVRAYAELTTSILRFMVIPWGWGCSNWTGSGCRRVENGFLTGLKLLTARAVSREVRVIFRWDLKCKDGLKILTHSQNCCPMPHLCV